MIKECHDLVQHIRWKIAKRVAAWTLPEGWDVHVLQCILDSTTTWI